MPVLVVAVLLVRPGGRRAGPALTSIVGTLMAGGSALTGGLAGGSPAGNGGRSAIGWMVTGGTSGLGPGRMLGTVIVGILSSVAGGGS